MQCRPVSSATAAAYECFIGRFFQQAFFAIFLAYLHETQMGGVRYHMIGGRRLWQKSGDTV